MQSCNPSPYKLEGGWRVQNKPELCGDPISKKKKARTLNVHVKDLAPRAEKWLQKRVFKKYLTFLKGD